MATHAYFDASISLLFFLLIGRTLDHMMRERARSAVKGLARLARARRAWSCGPMARCDYLPVGEIEPGMTILLAAGERVPVDARVLEGGDPTSIARWSRARARRCAVDRGIGPAGRHAEPDRPADHRRHGRREGFLPRRDGPADGGGRRRPLSAIAASRTARRGSMRRWSTSTALLTFIGWMVATGDLHRAITIAVAVLIITCPCALGLAVPMVHVVAARRLFESGIMVKDGAALERLAEIDTRHLRQDRHADARRGASCRRSRRRSRASSSRLRSRGSLPPSLLPRARRRRGGAAPPILESVSEQPGSGLQAVAGPSVYRLGRAAWALDETSGRGVDPGELGTVLSRDGRLIAEFRFDDPVRPGAREAIEALARSGYAVGIVSGDRPRPVGELAATLGVRRFEAGVSPAGKAAFVAQLAAAGRRVLMVGDGLNDAPALAAAHASMAPATAADVGRNAADFVFLRESLSAVPFAIGVARRAGRLIRQNFFLAVAYNLVAVPIAILGHVTPLIAALAMSLSSIIVVGNALRLKGVSPEGRLSRGRSESRAAPEGSPVLAGAK